MFLRVGVCGALLAVSLWCWRSGEDVPSSGGIVEDSAPGRSQWGQGDATENFSLGLMRTKRMSDPARRQIVIEVKTVDVLDGYLEDLGFDWLQDGLLEQMEGPVAPQPDINLNLSPEGGEDNGFFNLGRGEA